MRKHDQLRTIADLNAFNAVQNVKLCRQFLRAMSINYVAEQTALQFNRYCEESKFKTPSDAMAFVRLMPQFEVVAGKIYDELGDRRPALQQSSRAAKPRRRTYRIGPEVSCGPKGRFRLTRSFPGYVTEFVRIRRTPKTRARLIWKELGFELQNAQELFSDFVNQPHLTDPRLDFYHVRICDQIEKVNYIDFERCFAAAKKPQAFVG